MKPHGIKHVKGLAGQNGFGPQMRGTTKALKQQYKFVWGCAAAGNQLPCLVGLKSDLNVWKESSRSFGGFHKHRQLLYPPFLVVYNGKDQGNLVEIYRTAIIDPYLQQKQDRLKDGEYFLVYQDGGEREHLKRLTVTVEEQKENSTGQTSVIWDSSK
jgi:hypothetical protein